jgi:fumarate reductase subunit D
VASLVFIACNAVYKPVITRPLMEVTYSSVSCSHHSTTVLFTLFNIISHLRITDQTDSITTVITFTITKITRYLNLNIYIQSFFCQQMHSLLTHKMLQLTLKISLYMAPTCFGPLGPSSGNVRRNLAKVTGFVEIISKNTPLKLLLCSGNMCFSL